MAKNLSEIWKGKRQFDICISEEANGVQIASTEVFESAKGVKFHPDHCSDPIDMDSVDGVEAEGATPEEAYENLSSKLGGD